jgi:hypothetical protein
MECAMKRMECKIRMDGMHEKSKTNLTLMMNKQTCLYGVVDKKSEKKCMHTFLSTQGW